LKKKKVNIFPKEKPKKRKLLCQGRWEGMSSFFLKILPEARGWRFLEKPEGLELDSPGHRLIFAFLFLVLFLVSYFLSTACCWYWCGGGKQEKQP
jgi:hypothetical protein